jgi:hypothetical protein
MERAARISLLKAPYVLRGSATACAPISNLARIAVSIPWFFRLYVMNENKGTYVYVDTLLTNRS